MRIKFGFFILLLNTLATLAWAQPSTLRVLGIQGALLFEEQVILSAESVGHFSHSVLNRAKDSHRIQQYEGSDLGVRSINGLGSALEIISNTEMDAYGWCYRVDGKLSHQLANEHRLQGDERIIEWFYAYAHFDKTQWTSMCVSAQHKPSEE